jgi:hypothetical protein
MRTDPFEVGEVVRHAIETDAPTLRYAVSWSSAEIIAGRAAMSDEDWVELGRATDDADYVARFRELFGVDIST